MGNKFLSHIREVDAIVHVVRCFEDSNIVHVDGSIDPVRDMETINLELIFADMEMIDRRIDRAMKSSKSGDKKFLNEAEFYKRIKARLENGKPVRGMELSVRSGCYAHMDMDHRFQRTKAQRRIRL